MRGVLAVALALSIGCGSSPASPPIAPSPVDGVDLFGDWEWVRSCEAFVRAFRDAGMVKLTSRWLVDARYFAREDLIAPNRPCEAADEARYTYFFEASGRWGVLDDDYVMVEDRDFTIADKDTIAFGVVEVDFSVIGGDTLKFEVRSPDECDSRCRDTYTWAVATFAPAKLRRMEGA